MSGSSTPPWLKLVLNETRVNPTSISPIVSPIAIQNGRQSTEPFPPFDPPPSRLRFRENGYSVPVTPEPQTARLNECSEPPQMADAFFISDSPSLTHSNSSLAQPRPVFPSGRPGFSYWSDELVKKTPLSNHGCDDSPTLGRMGSILGSPFDFRPSTGPGKNEVQPTLLFGRPNPPTTSGSGPARPPTSFRRTPGGERMFTRPSPVQPTVSYTNAGGLLGSLTSVTQSFTAEKQDGGVAGTGLFGPRTPSPGSFGLRSPIRGNPGKKANDGPLLVNLGPDSPTVFSETYENSSHVVSFDRQDQRNLHKKNPLLYDIDFTPYPWDTPVVKWNCGEPSGLFGPNTPSSDASTGGVPIDPFTSPEPSPRTGLFPFALPEVEHVQAPVEMENMGFTEDNNDFLGHIPSPGMWIDTDEFEFPKPSASTVIPNRRFHPPPPSPAEPFFSFGGNASPSPERTGLSRGDLFTLLPTPPPHHPALFPTPPSRSTTPFAFGRDRHHSCDSCSNLSRACCPRSPSPGTPRLCTAARAATTALFTPTPVLSSRALHSFTLTPALSTTAPGPLLQFRAGDFSGRTHSHLNIPNATNATLMTAQELWASLPETLKRHAGGWTAFLRLVADVRSEEDGDVEGLLGVQTQVAVVGTLGLAEVQCQTAGGRAVGVGR
ncbi:hypothetical protein MMC30_004590 [Trapelia coarctata]|nr:hypothetical protein [Trapelia coarctata]